MKKFLFELTFLSIAIVGICASPTDLVSINLNKLKDSLKRQDNNEQSMALRNISNSGDAAIPIIDSCLKNSQENNNLKASLLIALSNINSTSSIHCIMNFAMENTTSTLFGNAMSRIINTNISYVIPQEKLPQLTEILSHQNVYISSLVARFLSRDKSKLTADIIHAVLNRYKKEAFMSNKANDVVVGSYLPARFFNPNLYLLAFENMDGDVVPVLKKELSESKSEIERKWLIFALGISGDKSVAEDLKNIISTEDDKYIRWIALRAYANSAKKEAIPILEKYINDTSINEYDASISNGEEKYFIRNLAKELILKVKKE